MDLGSFNFDPFAEKYDVLLMLREEFKTGKEKRCYRPASNTNGLVSEPLTCYGSCSRGCATFDLLDYIRLDAREDFMRNGVEREIDEVDRIKRQRNNSGCSDPTPSSEPYHVESVEYQSSRKGIRRSKEKKQKGLKSYCVFCENNGENYAFYSSHILKDEDGKVVCPILRMYTCPVCNVNGDDAHTLRYCPKAAEKRIAAAWAPVSARPSNKENPGGLNRD